MSWLLVAILSYLLLAITFLVDKYLLTGPIPSPKVYSFFVGFLAILVLVLIPFVDFRVPEISQIVLAFLAGGFFLFGLFWFYRALQIFEPSRIVPAIGGLLPLFTFGLVYISSRGKEVLTFAEFSAFILLVIGSILITYQKAKKISLKSLRMSSITALMFALHFVLIKYVYMTQPFWSGFIWIRIGEVLAALCLLFFIKEIKKEIFKQKASFQKKTAGIFLANQGLGTGGAILQNWAIALAPLAYVAIINALSGIQYVFLLIFAILISFKFPQILKEEISKKIIFQKIIAILLIGGGLALLAFK